MSQFFVNQNVSGGDVTSITGNTGTPATGAVTLETENATPQFMSAGSAVVLNFGIINLALGSSLPALTTGVGNTGYGYFALNSLTSGNNNVAVGLDALESATSAFDNIAIGYSSLGLLSSGNTNIAIGFESLSALTVGNQNICLGQNTNYTIESNNIIIGSGNNATVGDNAVIRIGNRTLITKCFIAGIQGVTVTSPVGLVNINALGQLGTVSGAASGFIQTITGNDSIPESPTAGNFNLLTANTTVMFDGTSSTETLNFGLSNLVLGTSLPSLTSGISNTGLGFQAQLSLTSGSANTAVGYQALDLLTTGSGNVGIGQSVGPQLGGANNTIIGTNAGSNFTGSSNVVIGKSAGSVYNVSESSNILIASSGVNGESNAIHIGTQGSSSGQQSTCYIAGIEGVTAVGSPVAVNSSTGQLSSLGFGTSGQVLTSTGATTSPTWQAIPTQILTYTNVNHAASPYTVLSTDQYISVDCSAGAVTLNFPNAPTAERQWVIKDRTGNAATHNITITTPGGTVTFDGSTSYVMDANYSAIHMLANSTPTYEIF